MQKTTLNLVLILFMTFGPIFFVHPILAHSLDRLHEHDLASNTYRNTPRPVDIRFIAPTQAGDAIGVITRFQAIESDHTLISAQLQWAGTSNDNSYLDIKAFSDRGERMLLSKSGEKKWRLNTLPGQWFEIHYSIHPNNNASSSTTQYRTILNKNIFHGIGQLLLVLPDDSMTDLLKVSIEWQDFERINWQSVQAVASNTQHETLSKSALLSSVFMAGDFQLHQTLTPYGLIKIAMQKNDWRFDGIDFASLARHIVQSEREFFGVEVNPEAAPFIISLVEVDKGLNGISIGGTSLHNSFAMFASPKSMLMQTDYGDPNTTVGFVLAHEMMHQWIGHDIKTSETPEALGYWFTEGFTDYFTLQVLYKSDLITLENYVDMLNGFLRKYWLSSQRNINNRNIASDFWRNKETQRIPYLRGFLVATVLDQRMRLVSDQRLRDMLQSMLKASDGITTHTAISNRSLLFNFQNRIGKDLGQHIKRVVNKGETVQIDAAILSPCLEIERKPLGDYDPGFDLDGSEISKKITGLKNSSAAYQAGLRNGQELAGWNFSGDALIKADVSIYTDKLGSVKTFKFYPVTETTLVPQASIMDPATCSAIL